MASSQTDPPIPEDPRSDVTGALHDVSNALTVLLGWVAEARAEEATRETVEFALDVIERRARMARALARRAIGAPTLDGDGEDDLDAVLQDVVAGLRVEAERAVVDLFLTIATSDASISSSGRALPMSVRVHEPADASHALTNLLLNAISHAPRGTSVAVRVSVSDRAVTIDVVDQGPGIAVERRERVFTGDSTRAGGAGVGLRHARAMARSVGGELELLAPMEGGPSGATFRLTWPRLDVRIPVPPPSITRVRPLEGRRVLVVEDDHDVVDLLETALGARGATVTVARTRSDLPSALVGEPHDAALLDLSPLSPDLAGALAALRAHSPGVQLVVITGSTSGLPEELAPEDVRWVRKPFEVGEVVEALTKVRTVSPSPPSTGLLPSAEPPGSVLSVTVLPEAPPSVADILGAMKKDPPPSGR